jgi:branched-subunit amino acid transport protein
MRLSFIAVFARRSMPPLVALALKFVPAAMLTALILPMIVAGPAAGAAWTSPKVLAALPAGAVAFLTQSTLKTLGTGMAALRLLPWLRR